MAKNDVRPIDPGMIARITRGAKNLFGGKPSAASSNGEYFGPLDPLPPQAPPNVAGRLFDYKGGVNATTQPRTEEPISFAQLRSLADNWDLMRLVIEKRKDQLVKLCWTIQPKDPKKKKLADTRIDDIIAFLAYPDKENDWDTWLRMLIEDMLVLDAACIYPRKTVGGQLYALEPVDGATIKRIIDDNGRTPLPPQPAYQQVLKGMPATNYTRDELLYLPRNRRTNHIYGMGPVEQVIMTVNIALRRQLHQLDYYTEGTVPDALAGVPETWTAEQIIEFQNSFDDMMSDHTAKRKIHFVPGGIAKSFIQTKEAAMKDEYDEWLARVLCFCFSVSNQAFIKQMSRAESETSADNAMKEGLEPLKKWIKSLIDRVITQIWGYHDLEFGWQEEESIDPAVQATVATSYAARAVITINEIRADLGRDPIEGGDEPLIFTATGAVKLSDVLNPSAPQLDQNGVPPLNDEQPPPEKNKEPNDLGKAHIQGGTHQDRPFVCDRRNQAADLWASFLRQEGQRAAQSVADQMTGLCKADGDEPTKADSSDPARIAAAAMDEAQWQAPGEATADLLKEVAIDGIEQGLKTIGLTATDLVSLANPRAVAWAEAHAAELVSGLADTTQAALRDLIVKAESEGWSVARLQQAIQDAYAFGPARARLIATHEMATADIMGNLIGWKSAQQKYGLKLGKRWIVSPDEIHCPACNANAMEGPIGLDETFLSGNEAAPAHPHCTCDLVAVPGYDSGRTASNLQKVYDPDQPRDANGKWAGGFDVAHEVDRGNKAMEHVIATKSDVHDAMNAPGRGPVSFVWGQTGNPAKKFKGGFGISKLIAKRNAEGLDGEGVARKMPEVIAYGQYGQPYGPTNHQRVNITYDGHTAVLSEDGTGRGHWLLTGWK